jgi:hypothetical protein
VLYLPKVEFDNFPARIFLDSSTLQTLERYGAFLYENEDIAPTDRLHKNPLGVMNLEALRSIMQVAQRAPFEFALSHNSFQEVRAKADPRYLQWAFDVLDHWETCLEEAGDDSLKPEAAALLDNPSIGYLSIADRDLLKDALALGCDSFLTMENRLPRNAVHLQQATGLRVSSPVSMWTDIERWAGLFC